MTEILLATPSAAKTQLPASLSRKIAIVALLSVWLASVLAGMYLMWRYESTPGSAEATQAYWPTASAIVPATDRPTLLMFLHPHCPCSRASLTELTAILSQRDHSVDARILFNQPPGVGDDWWQTELYGEALAIPGARVSLDPGSTEARCFGVKTSGHALLFSKDGRLEFSGGITAARGHVGQNAGRAALESILRGDQPAIAQSLVFGCPLTSAESGP